MRYNPFKSVRHKADNQNDGKPRRIRSGDAPIIRIGREKKLAFQDLYVNLLSLPWIALLPMIALIYVVVNLAFAALYYLNIDGIAHARGFQDVFFFSVQTMATIGYGYMIPTNPLTNTLTTVEALLGFVYFAFITGLMFAKFSRPTSNVLFSKIAVISDYEGEPHLKVRLANNRTNRIVDASARMFLLRHGMTKEGVPMRQFIDLHVTRDHMPSLRLTWTLMHPIDKNSPFYNMPKDKFWRHDDELFVTIVGLDETLSQTIHARHSYIPEEIIHDAFFEDVVRRNDTSVELNYDKFHSYHTRKIGEQIEDDKDLHRKG